jgi:predicted small lipoprotein YifL
MKKAISFILLQFVFSTVAAAQTTGPIEFNDDTNDATAAPIDDYIGVGIAVAILLTILVVRLKLTKANLSQH